VTPPLGVDVSEFQGVIDWPTVARSGVAFAFARATFGSNRVDARYLANAKAMRDAGVVPGAYHFLTREPVVAQAAAFVRWAHPHHMHALDVEYQGMDVAGWVAAYRKHYPTKPLIIYTGRDLWRAAVGAAHGSGPLWLAGAQPNAYVPGSGTLAQQWAKVGLADGGLPWGGWQEWSFMQYTNTAIVPGISGYVDGDAFNGSIQLLRDLGSTDMEPGTVIPVPGANPPTDTTVGHAIGAVYEVAASDLWGQTARSAAAAAASAGQAYASNLAIQQQLTALQTLLANLTMPAPAPVDVHALAADLIAYITANHVTPFTDAEVGQIADAFVAKLKAALP
jgi:lysozyme